MIELRDDEGNASLENAAHHLDQKRRAEAERTSSVA